MENIGCLQPLGWEKFLSVQFVSKHTENKF